MTEHDRVSSGSTDRMDPSSSTLLSDTSSYQYVPGKPSSSSDDVDSLPSTTATSSTMSEDDSVDDDPAEREWRESLQQLELLLTMVLIPYVGKYFGRKAAYWGWAKYMEWLYPVKIKVTNKALFRGAGLVEAAAML